MENRVEKAVALFSCGYNCSQAVFMAYADLFGIDPEVADKLSAPFGGGLGGMRHVCGTVSAMAMCAGLNEGPTGGDQQKKRQTFNAVCALSDKFRERHGSIVCSQLRGLEPGLPVGFTPKPCAEYVRTCAELIEETLLGETESTTRQE